MGGHGGLNILPQKRWNVYNFDNREKVRKDEEAAAREAQIQRAEARKRDAESRLEVLRNVRGLAPLKRASPEAEKGKDAVAVAAAAAAAAAPNATAVESVGPEERKTGHINLFEGIKIFDPIELPKNDKPAEEEDHRRKKMRKEAAATARASAKDAAAREGDPDEEKYRLGYGVAGKGVKLPWYLENKRKNEGSVRGDDDDGGYREGSRDDSMKKKKSGKKSLKELREERLKRERVEKERERALFMKQSQTNGGFSRR